MTKPIATVAAAKAGLPALLGGSPAFEAPIPITRPTTVPFEKVKGRCEAVLSSGMLTNSKNVAEFEAAAALCLGVKQAVAVSSCTSGLMLLMKVLGLKGEVIVPSFTFHATAHAAVWNGLTPVFVDCDPETYNIDPRAVEKAVTRKTSAIIGVHIFGNVCAVEALEAVAKKHNLMLLFDAAHGFGSRYRGRPVGGSGVAESFSLSPTKLVTAGEGGIVSTNDEELARRIRVGRNYGDPGTSDSEFSGFNARMSEFNAILGVENLKDVDKSAEARGKLAEVYRKRLSGIPGLAFQRCEDGNRNSYKDFSILIDEKTIGIGRDRLCEALSAENIGVKKYFYPPVHRQKAFAHYPSAKGRFPVTDRVAGNILSLPMYSHMSEEIVLRICAAAVKIHKYRKALRGGD